jgi:hypothetical protein
MHLPRCLCDQDSRGGRAFSWQLLGGIHDFLTPMVGWERRRSMTGEMP